MKRTKISDYLEEKFPEPRCELNYHKDYELLIAIVLSAQTTDKRVNMVTEVLFGKYPTLEKLANADIESLETIIRSLGSFKKKAAYIKELSIVLWDKFGGKVPTDREILCNLPGVGRKTVNVFLSEYYHEPAFGVDTHVDRVSKRLGIADEKDNVLAVENKLMEFFPKEEWWRRHLQLVLFGRYWCMAKKPECEDCKLKEVCEWYKKNTRS